MLDIKIVEFKCIDVKEDFYSHSLLKEDNAYTIEEFIDKYRAKYSKDKIFRKKIEFLKAVSINDLLIGEIFKFQTKFKIKTNIPYTKYYFYDDEVPHNECFALEKEIPKEQEEYINKIYRNFYINPYLHNIFIDLFYMQKVNLDDICLENIKISTYDGFRIPNGLTIEILSKSVSKTSLIDYIENKWNKEIKPLMKALPDTKDLITATTDDVKLYKLHNIDNLSYKDIRDTEEYFEKKFISVNSLKAYYNSKIKAVSKLFERKLK